MTVFQNTRSRRLSPAGGLGSIPIIVLATLIGGLLAACDDEDQSAVPPGAVSDLATVAAIATPEGENGEHTPGVLEDSAHGIHLPMSERVYFAKGGDIWQVPLENDPEPVAEDLEVLDYSASATGNRLALVRVERDAIGHEETSLSILLPDGTVLFDLSLAGDDVDLDSLSPISSVALSPDGNSLAMTHQNGAMTMASLSGDARQLVEPAEDQHPGRLAWSSDGRFIAYLDPWMPDHPSSLYVVVPESGVRQMMVQPSSSGHGVIRAEWIPGTSYIVYLKASGATIAHGGDLFVIDVTTGNRELLVASGEFAPVAGVVDIAPSPDGQHIAVTAFVPGEEYPAFSGLWTVDLRSGERTEVDLDDVHSVTDVWWLGNRLLVRAIDEPRTRMPGTYTGQEAFTLLVYSLETGDTEERYADNGG